jgi:orotidine-5'-phosphate decarboxylase
MEQKRTSVETHAADSLLAAIVRKGSPVCVGIDPVFDRLPEELQKGAWTRADQARAIGWFSRAVIEAVAQYVPCVKVQAACFERYGSDGFREMEASIAAARAAGLIVILDAKRGDIGISAEHYAAGAFENGDASADWITINSYLGVDGITPFLKQGHGAFALVRTSNPGGDEIQSAKLEGGETVAGHVAAIVARVGESVLGSSGYSALGAVIGATKREDAARLRERMPRQIFLVPGYGAQGGTMEDILPCFNADGRGAIVTASRSVIFAFQQSESDWAASIGRAAAGFAAEVAGALC